MYVYLCIIILRSCLFREWIERVPPENILRVLICLRMLMRDHVFQVQSVKIVLHLHVPPHSLGHYGSQRDFDVDHDVSHNLWNFHTFVERLSVK